VGKPEDKDHLEDPDVNGMIKIFRKWEYGLGKAGSG